VPWEWPIGALLAALIAFVTTPAGVSGAVLLLPVQVSVLGVPSPSVTPTNLLFNVAAIPGGLLRFGREGRLFGPLTWLLVAGTLPGVVAGAVIRVELLPGDRATAIVAAAVLLPLGVWLLAGARSPGSSSTRMTAPATTPGSVPATRSQVSGPNRRPSRPKRSSPPGIAATLNRRFVGVTDGLGTPSTLTCTGSSSTAPETPAGVVTKAISAASSAPIGHSHGTREAYPGGPRTRSLACRHG